MIWLSTILIACWSTGDNQREGPYVDKFNLCMKYIWKLNVWNFIYDDLSRELHACISCTWDEEKHALGANVDYWTKNANKYSVVYHLLVDFMWLYMNDDAGLKLLILNEMHKPPYAGHPGY